MKLLSVLVSFLILASSVFAGTVNLTNHVIHVATPTEDTHASTKKYTDDLSTNNNYVSDGGTTTSGLFTTRETFENDEYPTAGWVRSLALAGVEWYYTTNAAGSPDATKTEDFVELCSEPPATVFTNSIASPVLSDTYLSGGISTQIYRDLRSPVGSEIYMNRVGGNASSLLYVHPEVYYFYASEYGGATTNLLGDWECGDQLVAATSPTKYSFVVPFTDPAITGDVYLVAFLKSGTISGTAAGLNIVGGGVYASHLDIDAALPGDDAASVAADLASHEAETLADGAHGGVPAATNLLCWIYAVPATNWGPMLESTGTITRITSLAYSGGLTATVLRKHYTNDWGNAVTLGTMPVIATPSQSNLTWGVPSQHHIGVVFTGGATQKVVFSVGVQQ